MRLIDAHALIDEINEMWKIHPAGLENRKILSFEAVIDLIGAAPTIESKPVVHAHWEYVGESDGKKIYRCTNCQALLSGTGNFCKECGATMDEMVVEENATTTNNTQKVSVDGVKIPVISMEDVPKLMEEMEK